METADDDVLTLLFTALLAEEPQRFIWWRTTLPLVCRRWAQLLRTPRPGLFRHVVINAKAESAAVRRAGGAVAALTRNSADLARAAAAAPAPSGCAGPDIVAAGAGGLVSSSNVRAASPDPAPSPLFGSSPVPGSSPMRGGWVGSGTPPTQHSFLYHHHQQQQQQQQQQQPRQQWSSGGSALPAAAAGAGGGGTAAGSSPPPRLQHSASSSRMRARLSARRVHAWLHARSGAVEGATVDLRGPHDFTAAAVERLLGALATPALRRLRLAGAPVDAGDCCDALGPLRDLQSLDVTASAPSVLGSGGLSPLAYLPKLRTLVVSLDIAPACPNERLRDLPSALRHLTLSNMALAELPRQLADLASLSSVRLDRCAIAANPLPLLLSLGSLQRLEVNACPLPAQQQMQQQQVAAAVPAAGGGGRGGGLPIGHRRRSSSASGGGGGGRGGRAPRLPPGGLISSVSLVGCGLLQVPPALASLPALADLDVSLNPELGADVPGCLPAALADLTALRSLSLEHCGLAQLPPVVSELPHLTRLELGGNGLAALPHRAPACAAHLEALGLAGTRLRAPPAWLLQPQGTAAPNLRELSVGAGCLAGAPLALAAPPPTAHGVGGGGSSSSGSGIISAAGPCSGAGVSAALGALSVGAEGGGGGWLVAPGASDPAAPSPSPPSANGHHRPWLRDLPERLPGLKLLRVEGAVWEQAAVRNLASLLSRPRGASALRVELV